MALLDQWRELAYKKQQDQGEADKFWKDYFQKETSVYEQLLSAPNEVVEGTVTALAKKYDLDIMTMTGFLDGINDSLVKPNPIEKMKETTKVSLAFDKESLYKNMIKAKADWLYNLPQWEAIFDEEKRKELFKEQKKSGTIVKDGKVYPNDPCPCGSGKKYKKCCGR
jgi:preprotein translocase subunit SecA